MDDPSSQLLPYILETLSHKPKLCDTYENLCEEIAESMEQQYPYKELKKLIVRALIEGQSLGIITLSNEIIRVPFNFCNGKGPIAPMTHFDGPAPPKEQSKIKKKMAKQPRSQKVNPTSYGGRMGKQESEYFLVRRGKKYGTSSRPRVRSRTAMLRGRRRYSRVKTRGRQVRATKRKRRLSCKK